MRACAENGTDYLDLTGETEFIDTMYVRYHERAVASGARLIHACGFDSIPYDLGVQYTVAQLPPGVPLQVAGLVRAGGTLSGGTFSSALTAFSRGRQNLAAAQARRRVEPRPQDRTARAVTDRIRRIDGFWAVPLPTVDPQIVARSARALPSYGPDFRLPPLRRGSTAAGGGRRRRRCRSADGRGPGTAAAQRAVANRLRRATGRGRSGVPGHGSAARFIGPVAGGGSSPRCPAGIPGTARRRRCSASRRCASRSTTFLP